MWLKVDNTIINTDSINCQLTLDEGATIYLEIDIEKYPDYSNFFIDKYENNKKFSIESSNYSALGCYIKRIDILFNKKISMDITCEKIDTDVSKRSDKIISDILEQK